MFISQLHVLDIFYNIMVVTVRYFEYTSYSTLDTDTSEIFDW